MNQSVQNVNHRTYKMLVPQPRWQRIARHQASSIDLSVIARTTICCRHTTAITCCSRSHWNGASIPQNSSKANMVDGGTERLDCGCPPLCRHRWTQSVNNKTQ